MLLTLGDMDDDGQLDDDAEAEGDTVIVMDTVDETDGDCVHDGVNDGEGDADVDADTLADRPHERDGVFVVERVDDLAVDRVTVSVTLMLRDVDFVYVPDGVTVLHVDPVGVFVQSTTVGVRVGLIVGEIVSTSDASTDTVGVNVVDSVDVVDSVFVIDGEPDTDGVTERDGVFVAVIDCDPDTVPHRDTSTETDGLRESEFVAELELVVDCDPETVLHREPAMVPVGDREIVGDADWENDRLDESDATADHRMEPDTVMVPDVLVVDVGDGVSLFVTDTRGVDEMLADTQKVPEFVGVSDAEEETDGDGVHDADAEPLTDARAIVFDGVELVVDEGLTSRTLGDEDADTVRD